MYWLVSVYDEDGHTNCAVHASSEKQACFKAFKHFRADGMKDLSLDDVEAREFNTFDDGDPRDYELIT